MSNLSFITQVPIAIASTLEAAMGFTFYPYSPTRIGDVFDNLPCGVVDYDPATPHDWTRRPDQGYQVTLTYIVEIYIPLVTADAGAASDAQLKHILEDALIALLADPTLGGKVDRMWIMASQIELIAAKIEQTGQKCRWCWIKPRVAVTIAVT